MREAGFTLVELMIAVAILAIIAAVAMPIYNQYTQRTFRAEAQADLMNCAQGMERYAAVNFDYEGADLVFDTICNPRSVDRYTITVEDVEPDRFTLRAEPIGQMAGTGDLTYDNTGARTWNGNDSWDE
ncbi:MAG: type IV pilin protein [Pseudomonadales bacterium]